MNTRFERDTSRTLMALVTGALLIGLSASAHAADDTLYAHAFSGEVDEDLFIGVLVADRPSEAERKALVVYLCDGADVSTWVFAEAEGDSAVVETGGTRVQLSLAEDSVFGVVERPGVAPQGFVADLATAPAGLYRGIETFDGREYVGGWIVLDDGRQRGAMTLDGVVVENPTLDLSTGEAETTLGAFGTNCFINPRTGEKVCRYLN